MSYGITDEGFVRKRLSDIKAEMETAYKSALGAGINVDAQSPLGQIIGISSDLLAVTWELVEALYNSTSPNTAEGVSLDQVAMITNLTRMAATKSTATITITGTNGTTVPSGFVVSVSGNPSARFASIGSGIISGGTLTLGSESEKTGPVLAPAGSLTVIETPISGVSSVTNATDAIVGRNTETDAEFRTRRMTRQQLSGTATLEGIRNALLEVEDVIQAAVYENTGSTYDIYGRPAKSIECVVSGGADSDIARAIFEAKGAGIQAYGTEIETVTDSQGVAHDIGFTRPEDVEIYLIVNIDTNSDLSEGDVYPNNGDDLIKAVIVDYAKAFVMGQDVVINKFWTPINTVPGVIGIEILAGTTSPPSTSINIPMDPNQLAVFDTARITVNS